MRVYNLKACKARIKSQVFMSMLMTPEVAGRYADLPGYMEGLFFPISITLNAANQLSVFQSLTSAQHCITLLLSGATNVLRVEVQKFCVLRSGKILFYFVFLFLCHSSVKQSAWAEVL